MHREGSASLGPLPRLYIPLLKLAQAVLIRMGPVVGTVIALGVEVASADSFYAVDRMLTQLGDDSVSDLVLFHMLEEVEHGALTIQILQDRSTLGARLLALGPSMVLYFVMFLGTPLLAFLRHPLPLLQKPGTMLKVGTMHMRAMHRMSQWRLTR